jgi:hypothetical protein
MFEPDYQVENIKPKAFRPPEDCSKRGEMSRRILDILREARRTDDDARHWPTDARRQGNGRNGS